MERCPFCRSEDIYYSKKRKLFVCEDCDETFGEDKSTIKKGKNTMSTLRKCSYNIVRLLQMKDQKGREYVPDIIDDICDDLEIDLRMIFSPIPSFY